MKRILYSILLAAFCVSAGMNFANAQNICATEDEFQEQAKTDPSLLQKRMDFEKQVADYISKKSASNQSQTSVPRIIPVVVHVIHDCGVENISKAQILDQIRVLNEDFRRLNADTGSTPAAFKSVAADCNVEFRMAQMDPNGNCTDGIVRVESYLTNACVPRDRVKSVSYWPSSQYLNIWVVKYIDPQGQSGRVLGYAQFPGGNAFTDGIVLVSDFFGTIGTAASNQYAGRSCTHEVGHWLSLRHTWGDDNGACGGNGDYVNDTPDEADNYFGCHAFPYYDACNTSGNGVMIWNYMDYTDGDCQNLFTAGQKARMDATFSVYRSNIISASNNTATGTDGTPAVICPPLADFCIQYDHICAGDSVTFTNCSYNADTVTYSWSFPGGTPSTSTLANPVIKYFTPGTYNATLTTTSSGGPNSKTKNNCVIVSGAPALSAVYYDDFETSGTFPGNGGFIENPDGSVYKWSRVTGVTGYSGTACLKMSNGASNHKGEVDSWITPSFDLSNFTSCQFTYRVAYAQNTVANLDYLKIYYSLNCGKFWTLRGTKNGATLATTTSLIPNFSPTSTSQWRLETPPMGAVNGKSNVRFKFEFTAGPDNNLYIDDINVTGTPTVIEEIDRQNLNFTIFPNPSSGSIFVSFNTMKYTEAEVSIANIVGQTVKSVMKGTLSTGAHGYFVDTSNLAQGLYFVRVKAGEVTDTRKLIVQ